MQKSLLFPVFPRILNGGGDYNPDQWLETPGIIDDDFRLMELSRCDVFSVGIFSWSQLEPEEGGFTFDWLDDILDRFEASGKKSLFGHACRSSSDVDGEKVSGMSPGNRRRAQSAA